MSAKNGGQRLKKNEEKDKRNAPEYYLVMKFVTSFWRVPGDCNGVAVFIF